MERSSSLVDLAGEDGSRLAEEVIAILNYDFRTAIRIDGLNRENQAPAS